MERSVLVLLWSTDTWYIRCYSSYARIYLNLLLRVSLVMELWYLFMAYLYPLSCPHGLVKSSAMFFTSIPIHISVMLYPENTILQQRSVVIYKLNLAMATSQKPFFYKSVYSKQDIMKSSLSSCWMLLPFALSLLTAHCFTCLAW